jgi:hypothetical protein
VLNASDSGAYFNYFRFPFRPRFKVVLKDVKNLFKSFYYSANKNEENSENLEFQKVGNQATFEDGYKKDFCGGRKKGRKYGENPYRRSLSKQPFDLFLIYLRNLFRFRFLLFQTTTGAVRSKKYRKLCT